MRPPLTFRAVVKIALTEWLDDREPVTEWTLDFDEAADEVATHIVEHLKPLEIHNPVDCGIRPKRRRNDPRELGRLMTPDEQILVGLLAVGEVLDVKP